MNRSVLHDYTVSDSNKANKIILSGAQQTLLITLYAKALDNRSNHSILHDKKADEIVRSIDFDFDRAQGFGSKNILVVRAKQFDEWVNEFIKSNPNGIVLNLGCGLDARVARIKPSPTVDWFDLDFPEVIEERRKFFPDGDGYHMIKSSMTEPGWIESIPKNRPTIVVADGVLEYLTEDEVRILFNRITSHFPSGQVAFDVMSSAAMKRGKKRLKDTMPGVEHKWAVDNIQNVDELDPKLKRIDVFSIFGSKYVVRLPMKERFIYRLASLVPNFKNMIRLVRYEF